MKRIVVPTDFSEAAALAMEQAEALARQHGARITLIHAANVTGATPDVFEWQAGKLDAYREAVRRDLQQRRGRLDSLVSELRGRGLNADSEVVDGPADEAIVEVARSFGADLIVLGTHTGAGPFHLGSVTTRVVRAAEQPVLVARQPVMHAQGFRRILHATDFEAPAGRALELAARLAAPEAAIELLHCWHVGAFEVRMEAYSQLREHLMEQATLRAGELIEKVTRRGLTLTFRAVDAPSPAQRILEALDADPDIDLVAVGSHGRRGWQRLVAGSVAEAVVRYAARPVLVVR
jgi:nucleotide-binding universal stress UspA family protein